MPALGSDESPDDFAGYAKALVDAAMSPQNKTKTEWVKDYLDYISKVRGLRPNTHKAYSRVLKRFIVYLKANRIPNYKEVKPKTIYGFLAELSMAGKSANSINQASAALRSFYRHLRRFGLLKVDPTRDLENIKTSRPLPAFLTEAEAAKLCEYITVEHPQVLENREFYPFRDRALIEFLYSTGCRVAEVAGVKMSDLDLKNGKAKVLGKGNKERMVFIAGAAKRALREYLIARERFLNTPMAPVPGVTWKRGHYKEAQRRRPQSLFLFINREGQGLSIRGIQFLVRKYSVAAGVRPISPHALRHSFATGLVNAGLDIRMVQELMGHANVSTTGIYVHTDIKRLTEVYRRAHPHAHGRRLPVREVALAIASPAAPCQKRQADLSENGKLPSASGLALPPAAPSLGRVFIRLTPLTLNSKVESAVTQTRRRVSIDEVLVGLGEYLDQEAERDQTWCC